MFADISFLCTCYGALKICKLHQQWDQCVFNRMNSVGTPMQFYDDMLRNMFSICKFNGNLWNFDETDILLYFVIVGRRKCHILPWCSLCQYGTTTLSRRWVWFVLIWIYKCWYFKVWGVFCIGGKKAKVCIVFPWMTHW